MIASSSLRTLRLSAGLFHQTFSITQFEFSLLAAAAAVTAEQMELVGWVVVAELVITSNQQPQLLPQIKPIL